MWAAQQSSLSFCCKGAQCWCIRSRKHRQTPQRGCTSSRTKLPLLCYFSGQGQSWGGEASQPSPEILAKSHEPLAFHGFSLYCPTSFSANHSQNKRTKEKSPALCNWHKFVESDEMGPCGFIVRCKVQRESLSLSHKHWVESKLSLHNNPWI